MLSHLQFSQLNRILQGNFREVVCPCGAVFYSFSPIAMYHNNACRQKYFRMKKSGVVGKIENKIVEIKITKQEEQVQEPDNELLLNKLLEKNNQLTRKLKNL